MVVVGTKYDKELKEKVFYVREVDSYSHKTVTSLSVDWVDGVFTLTAVVGNLIGKGFVKFYRDGVEVGEQYVSKTATLLLQSETNTGVFVAKFMGNSDCLKSQSDEVSYSPLPTPAFTLTASKNSGVVGDTVSFTASLPSDATGTITYTVDGASYTKNVGETFSYKFNKEGSFPVTAVYSGDSNYQGNTASVSVIIDKIGVSFSGSASSTTVYVGETVTISGTLKTSTGSPLSNVKIIDGAGVVKATTDSGGAWSFTNVESVAGTGGWVLTPELDWSKYSKPSNVIISITARKKDTVLTCTVDKSSVIIGENVLCTLYLKDSQNNPLANKTVYCGDWSKTTNDEGRVLFNHANPTSGIATRVFKFDGDNLYNGASVTAKWTVVPAENPPQISISASGLIGEVGDDLPITLSSNLKNTALTILLNDAEVADSVTTDNAGNAVFNYNCNGVGDVEVKVKYVNGANVYYSNILTVEDCLFYDTMTIESDRWVRTMDIIVNIDSEGTKFSTNSNSEQKYRLPSKYFTPPYTIEFDWVEGGGNQKMGFELYPNNQYTGDTFWYSSHWDSGANKFIISTYPSSTSSSKTEANITRSINPNDHLKFIVEPDNVKLYQNGELILSKYQGKTCDTQYFCFYTNKNRIQKVKNLKIKPYSE